MTVAFIGLSNKPGKEPLDNSTASGKIIDKIISKLNTECYKLNLIDFAPLDENGKLRYPTKSEIQYSLPSFYTKLSTLNPDITVLLGAIVSNSVEIDNSIVAYHPAYAIRRGMTEKYIYDMVSEIILKGGVINERV